tara:strand:+ start:1849 stop:2118 length:270 start_codon:yes stop_codon:yes gene_type:complete
MDEYNFSEGIPDHRIGRDGEWERVPRDAQSRNSTPKRRVKYVDVTPMLQSLRLPDGDADLTAEGYEHSEGPQILDGRGLIGECEYGELK